MLKILEIRALLGGLPGDRLNHRQKVLRAVRKLAHDEFDVLRTLLAIRHIGRYPDNAHHISVEDREEKSMLRILEGANADILCFGHTHKPYHRVLNSGTERNPQFRHAINIGSVGKPKDGDPRGGYVLLEMDEHSNLKNEQSIRVEFVRFEYDVEKAAEAVGNSPLPNAYATALRVGK